MSYRAWLCERSHYEKKNGCRLQVVFKFVQMAVTWQSIAYIFISYHKIIAIFHVGSRKLNMATGMQNSHNISVEF